MHAQMGTIEKLILWVMIALGLCYIWYSHRRWRAEQRQTQPEQSTEDEREARRKAIGLRRVK